MRGWGILASVVWAVVVAAYAVGFVSTRGDGGTGLVFTLLVCAAAALIPLGLVWWIGRLDAALATRDDSADTLRGEVDVLRAEVRLLSERVRDAEGKLTRQAEEIAKARAVVPTPAVAVQPSEPGPATPKERSAPLDTSEAAADEAQPALPLVGGADSAPMTLSDTIQALDFPRDAQDTSGFAVLRRALQSRDLAKLLQASEDCLNLLAHQGIYTDDLMPAPASAADWRQFAKGGAARAELMPLTGITDQNALETVQAEMRRDPIFRDTALYFQRRFDRMLQDAAPDATDEELLSLVDTRSGRAFVLLVQVSGLKG